MSLGSPAPAVWYDIPTEERAERVQLSSDQCVIDDKHFYLLGRLELPVIDSSDAFTWLTWVSVSESNFERASELWDAQGRESEPPYFVWVQSALPYPGGTLSLKGQLHTRPLGERPMVYLEPSDHPLSIEQRSGITIARVQAIVEDALHGGQP